MKPDAATIVATTASTDEKEWITASIGPSGFRTEISAGPHRFHADEPVPLGGTGTGPTPYELLLGARQLHGDDPSDVRRPQALAAARRANPPAH